MEIKGYTYGYGGRAGVYRTPDAITSQDLLFDTGVNWICLASAVNQDTYASTDILFDYRYNASDKDLTFVINRAHERGIKVCLKPMINCKDGAWRAQIDFPDGDMIGRDIYWSKWFESYTAFLLHYAELAEDTDCEMFCLGCEMLGTERKEEYWRELIAKVREVYHGPLVYNTNHGHEDKVPWFDAIDYIGTSAYYRVAKCPGDSLENMTAAWEKVRDHLKPLSEKLGKKVIFMEIGCRSAKGCAMMPWDFSHPEFPRDEEEQARFYESVLSVFSKEDWFAGFFWWDWSTRIYTDPEVAAKDTGFNIHMKKAEDVLKKWYNTLP
ncbi:MAG: glycosyl hydrolase family 53 [Lachnospiraceae bacterium]|nr:glycosyl hydrolase family 53 [Lachnospiraceae bacterium]